MRRLVLDRRAVVRVRELHGPLRTTTVLGVVGDVPVTSEHPLAVRPRSPAK